MRTVLACIDLSDVTDTVLACARELAAPNGHLVLLHVAAPDPEFVGYDVGPQSVRDEVALELRAEHRRVQALAEGLATSGLTLTPLTVQGAVVERILEHAARLQAQWIVVGSKGRGVVRELIGGSTVHALLHAAKLPVVVVPVSA